MKTDSVYFSFLLRIWKPDRRINSCWRLSLENPHTHAITTYQNLESFFTDLQRLMKPSMQNDEPPHAHD
jgi:hypothetical protein